MNSKPFVKIANIYTPQWIHVESIVYAEERTELSGEPALFLTLSTGATVTIKNVSSIKEIRDILNNCVFHVTDTSTN